MKKILLCSVGMALASCVQQTVGTPSPAVAPSQPTVILPSAAPAAKVATPVAKTTTVSAPQSYPAATTVSVPQSKPVAKTVTTPQPKIAVAVPQAKPTAPAAAPAPLPPLRGTHSTIIQESDRVQSARSMGGSATYAH